MTHHEMRKHVETVLKKKNSLKPNATSHNNASWNTDTDGFLEHSPSGGSLYYKRPALQKIILFFSSPPLHFQRNWNDQLGPLLSLKPQTVFSKGTWCVSVCDGKTIEFISVIYKPKTTKQRVIENGDIVK